MKRFSKSDIDFHGDWRSNAHVAVNVKALCCPSTRHHGRLVYNFAGQQALDFIMRDFACNEDEAEKALGYAWECQQEIFWNDYAQEIADDVLTAQFGHVKVFSEGRSGGWLVVYQGSNAMFEYEVEHWDAIKVATWGRFVKAIKAEVAWLCSYENIRDLIEANEWLSPIPTGLVETA